MRNRIVGLCFFVNICWAAGCAAPPPVLDSVKEHPRALITGILLRPGEEIRTRNIFRGQIRYRMGNRDKYVDMLLGPYPYTAAVTDAVAWYDNPVPRVFCEAGWCLLAGDWPLAQSALVDATADGCTIILQIDGPIHRVYLLRKTGRETGTVTLRANDSIKQVWVADQDRYVQVDPVIPNVITPPAPVSTAAVPIQNFVAYVKARASEAEVREADPLP